MFSRNVTASSKIENEEKNRLHLESLLDSVLENAKNCSNNPIEEFNANLAIFHRDEEELIENFSSEVQPKKRGASRNLLKIDAYKSLLTTLESSIINQTPSVKCKKENINELNFSPLRLLTEYRRKLILNSLCDFKDVNIDREIARKSECKLPPLTPDKAARYCCPDKTTHQKIRNHHQPTQPQLKHHNHHHTNKNKNNGNNPTGKSHSKFEKEFEAEKDFIPNWEDYSVMKHRWNSLLPQTKRLITESELRLPTSSSNMSIHVHSMNDPIQGRFLDAEYFDNTIASITRSKSGSSVISKKSAVDTLKGSHTRSSIDSTVRSNISTVKSNTSNLPPVKHA